MHGSYAHQVSSFNIGPVNTILKPRFVTRTIDDLRRIFILMSILLKKLIGVGEYKYSSLRTVVCTVYDKGCQWTVVYGLKLHHIDV